MPRANRIDFYFDFSSPYGYLAAELIEPFAEQHAVEVIGHPILLGVIFQHTQSMPLTQIPLKADYARHDFARSAAYYGIPYQEPTIFSITTLLPARAFYWMQYQAGGANAETSPRAKEFAQMLFRAYFRENRSIDSEDEILRIGVCLGWDRLELAPGLQDPSVKEMVRQEVELAIKQRVFGSPFFIANREEVFWGVDRLPQLAHWLQAPQIQYVVVQGKVNEDVLRRRVGVNLGLLRGRLLDWNVAPTF